METNCFQDTLYFRNIQAALACALEQYALRCEAMSCVQCTEHILQFKVYAVYCGV